MFRTKNSKVVNYKNNVQETIWKNTSRPVFWDKQESKKWKAHTLQPYLFVHYLSDQLTIRTLKCEQPFSNLPTLFIQSFGRMEQ